MFRADIGDFLYFIILFVLVFAGSIEKFIKKKKQEAQKQYIPTSDELEYKDDFEEAEQEVSSRQHLEEMLNRTTYGLEPRERERFSSLDEEAQSLELEEAFNNLEEMFNKIKKGFDEGAQSLEIIPEKKKSHYPERDRINIPEEGEITSIASEETSKSDLSFYREFDFDIRKAIIASEILNRKY